MTCDKFSHAIKLFRGSVEAYGSGICGVRKFRSHVACCRWLVVRGQSSVVRRMWHVARCLLQVASSQSSVVECTVLPTVFRILSSVFF